MWSQRWSFLERDLKISVIFSVFSLSKGAQQKPQLNLSSSTLFSLFFFLSAHCNNLCLSTDFDSHDLLSCWSSCQAASCRVGNGAHKLQLPNQKCLLGAQEKMFLCPQADCRWMHLQQRVWLLRNVQSTNSVAKLEVPDYSLWFYKV